MAKNQISVKLERSYASSQVINIIKKTFNEIGCTDFCSISSRLNDIAYMTFSGHFEDEGFVCEFPSAFSEFVHTLNMEAALGREEYQPVLGNRLRAEGVQEFEIQITEIK